jgi:hypothetical protein
MALDIHRIDTNEYIFSLNDERYNCLSVIFEQFGYRNGREIDPYGDTIIDNGNIKLLIQLIDEYIQKTDLNKNKNQTSIILEFKGILNIFLEKNIALKFVGD